MPSLLITSAVAFAVYWTGSFLWRYLRYRLLRKQTCVLDLEQLGLSRSADQKIHGTAVICGGSLAGLFAARVCHDHFNEVVIVEPEVWADRPDAKRQDAWNQENTRSRIMQYESLHGPIQRLAFMALCNLFTDFRKECEASDILVGPADYPVSTWGRWSKKPYGQYNGVLPDTLTASRRGLETLLRRLVLGGRHKNIRQVIGTVTGVSRSASNPEYLDRVTIRTTAGAQEINAALVIDCTGAASAGMKWLRREGYGQAETHPSRKLPLDELKITYDQKIVYSTLKLHVPPELGKRLPGLPASFDKCGLIYVCLADPVLDCRGISLQRIEGNFVQICCAVFGSGELPRTLEEIKKYTRSIVLRDPMPEWFLQILDMLEEVEDTLTCSQVPFRKIFRKIQTSITELMDHRRLAGASYTRFDKAVNLPPNWIAIGDSVMKVNPLFGQGIVKALMGAICLNTMLQKRNATVKTPKEFSAEFFEMQGNKISPFWDADKVWDYGYHTTVPIAGEKLADSWFLRWYTRKLIMLSFDDEQAGSVLWHANMQLTPQIDAMHPIIVLKILWATFKGFFTAE
ncbi:uncharacterized protein EV420DRAFT_1635777 [Desarmillaria tabescens]|uniref:FAD/NAD(P)-binding domain-containing protein n=1 Tax=Armillaria tabescens TaxID=1929756 RepID=A0AA39NJF0_ARMTA|nr:uncharacterized protein EV420DRAFT_1635777 [Desarmillaria tabescens]KAK0466735.1 hypothetical protein EV420DRAFT_1635777 [Desarmillaria tabescens]